MPSSTKKPRKHVSTACTACRKRKAKCDGMMPQCSSCKSGGRPCTYPIVQDRRRLFKVAAAPLLDRIKHLEQRLRENGITDLEGPLETGLPFNTEMDEDAEERDGAPLPYSNRIVSSDIPRAKETSSDFESQSPEPQHSANSITTGLREVRIDTASSNGGDDRAIAAISDSQDSSSPLTYQTAFVELRQNDQAQRYRLNQDTTKQSGTSESDTNKDEDHLLLKVGSLRIAEDGQLRFFGATSNLHMLQTNAPLSVYCGQIRTTQGNVSDILSRAGVGQKVPIELEDHLIKLYFAWEDPSIHVIDREAFWQARAEAADNTHDTKSGSYSELLTNTMCAIGVAFSDRVISDLPQPLAEFFAFRAKALLDIEMDSPTVVTVQALVLMSAHEAAFARDARGWLYSGMAMRLAIDLGLHLNVTRYVQAGLLNEKEAHLRKTTFWGTYVLDKFWSYYVGRPPMLNTEDITISPPSDDDEYSWTPYIDEEHILQPYNGVIQDIVRAEIHLCEAMHNCRKSLFADTTISKIELEHHAQQTSQELLVWLKQLPPSLWVNMRDETLHLPHVLQLNMQYHEIIIFVNRQFVSTAVEEWADEHYARLMCTTSASAIANLLSTYRRQWTLRRVNIQAVHISLTASLIHLYNLSVGPTNDPQWPQSLNDLKICCEALSEMSQAFNSSRRALNLIERVKVVWQEDLEAKRMSQQPFSFPGALTEKERWARIDAAFEESTKGAMGKKTSEAASWKEGFSHLQSVLGGDPFALAAAGFPALESHSDGMGLRV